MIQIYIWQLPTSSRRCFRPVNYNEVDLRDYVLVYDKEVDKLSVKNIIQFLEELYGSFQVAHEMPFDYHARPISISDLILFRDTEKNEIDGYVVDLTGFKKVKVLGFME